MTGPAAKAALAAAVLAAASSGDAGGPARTPLRPLSRGQVAAAGAAGAGCSWLSTEGALLFAAADDRAVVRLGREVVPLRPARGASELFPFTWTAWTGPGLVIRLLPSGRPTRRAARRSRAKRSSRRAYAASRRD